MICWCIRKHSNKYVNIKNAPGGQIQNWIRSERHIPSTVNQKILFNPQHSSIGRKKKLFFPPPKLCEDGSASSLPAGFTERFDRQLDGLFLLKDFTLLSRTLRSHKRIYRLCFPERMNVCMISVVPVKNGSRGDGLRVQRATGELTFLSLTTFLSCRRPIISSLLSPPFLSLHKLPRTPPLPRPTHSIILLICLSPVHLLYLLFFILLPPASSSFLSELLIDFSLLSPVPLIFSHLCFSFLPTTS